MHANANKPTDPSEHWCLAQGGKRPEPDARARGARVSHSQPPFSWCWVRVCGGETRTWDGNGGRKQLPLPRPFPVHNKLSHRSGDNYLSHIIKHLEQIGGSNYRLPPGYPSPFIVLPPYITWWDLLCCAFSRAILFAPAHGEGRYIDKRSLMARCTPSKSFVILSPGLLRNAAACHPTRTKVNLPRVS